MDRSVYRQFSHWKSILYSSCRHIIICGGITFETVTTVVKNFIHEDAAMEKTDIVIIDV